MRLPGARAGAHSIISVYIYIQLYLCNYYHHDHGLQINVMKVITVYQAIHGYSPIYKTRQDKTRQVYSANTMPGHQHTEVSTHTCTHQTHLTT